MVRGDQWTYCPDKFQEIQDGQYQKILTSYEGRGGTYTSQIAKYLNSQVFSKPLDIIIITDGIVDTNDISTCDSILSSCLARNTLQINSVTAFIVAGSVNASVLAPFIRGDWTSNIYHCPNSTTCFKPVYSVEQIERKKIFSILPELC